MTIGICFRKQTVWHVLAMTCLISTTACGEQDSVGAKVDRVREAPLETMEEHLRFVAESLDYVNAGAHRADVVDALASIATTSSSMLGQSAVRAMVHIAGNHNDGRLQDQLLRVVRNNFTQRGTRVEAARMLAMDANSDIRGELLDYVKSRWGKQEATDATTVLFDCGDVEYLRFLEESLKADPEKKTPRFDHLEYQMRHLRVADRPLQEVLAIIASDDLTYDKRWLVHQAMRRGADPKLVAAAVGKYLSLPEGTKKHYWKRALIRTGARLSIFSNAQRVEYGVISDGRDGLIIDTIDPAPWATYHETKWLKVHGVDVSAEEQE